MRTARLLFLLFVSGILFTACKPDKIECKEYSKSTEVTMYAAKDYADKNLEVLGTPVSSIEELDIYFFEDDKGYRYKMVAISGDQKLWETGAVNKSGVQFALRPDDAAQDLWNGGFWGGEDGFSLYLSSSDAATSLDFYFVKSFESDHK